MRKHTNQITFLSLAQRLFNYLSRKETWENQSFITWKKWRATLTGMKVWRLFRCSALSICQHFFYIMYSIITHMPSYLIDPMTCELSIQVTLVQSTTSSPLIRSCMWQRRDMVDLSVWQSGTESLCYGKLCRESHFSGISKCGKLSPGKCTCSKLCSLSC